MDYKIDFGLGEHILLEPEEKSTVFEASEVSTVFKVVDFGAECHQVARTTLDGSKTHINIGDLVIVEPSSLKESRMGGEKVYWVYQSEVVAKVTKNV